MSGPGDILMSFLALSSRPNALPDIEDMWYRKRDEMAYVAVACGVENEFKNLSPYVHRDDLRHVKQMLDITDACMEQLFEKSDVSFE